MTFQEDSLEINASKICIHTTAAELTENDPMTMQKIFIQKMIIKALFIIVIWNILHVQWWLLKLWYGG